MSAASPLRRLRWTFRRLAWEDDFESPELERAWRRHFNASHLKLDITSCFVSIIMSCVELPKSAREARAAPAAQTAIVAAFFASSYAYNLALLWLIRARRDWYVAHRCGLLTAYKIFRAAAYCGVMWRADHYFLLYSPLELPPGRWKALMRGMLLPSIMMRFAMMWQLPVADARVAAGAALGMGMYDAFGRCTAELEAVPGQGARYGAAMDAVTAAATRWGMPAPALASRDSGAFVLGDFGACVAVKSTAQVVVGYALPMCALAAEEAASRSLFSLATGHAFRLRPSLAVMIAQNLLLLPLQAALAFVALTMALRWAGL